MTIRYTHLAELAEAMELSSAVHLRESAATETDAETDAGRDAEAELEAVLDALAKVPEPSASVKHADDCWKRHARCLADRILDGQI